MTHPLAAAQQSLAEAARAAWDHLETDLRDRPAREHRPGARLIFLALDPTVQVDHHKAGPSIVVRQGDERFVFPLDGKLAKKMSALRELQITFGWPIARETAWNVVADIVETRELEGSNPPDPKAPTREHELAIRSFYVPGQAFIAEEVAGLEHATRALEETLPPIALPDNALPEALVGLLPKILASHHWRAFDALCAPDFSMSDRRMAFEQLRQAWITSGALTFESYDRHPNTKYENDVVRTLIRRAGSKPGEVLVRPLLWVKREGGWRFAGGAL